MKKLLTVCLSIMVIIASALPVCAAEAQQPIMSSETVLEDGIVMIDEVFEITTARSADKTYTRQRTFVQNGTTIGIIAITATFRYDSSTVSVVSKSVSQADTYDGWSYKQNSFTSSGGTVALDAKLTKLLILNIPVTMTLTCDKSGNISYT